MCKCISVLIPPGNLDNISYLMDEDLTYAINYAVYSFNEIEQLEQIQKAMNFRLDVLVIDLSCNDDGDFIYINKLIRVIDKLRPEHILVQGSDFKSYHLKYLELKTVVGSVFKQPPIFVCDVNFKGSKLKEEAFFIDFGVKNNDAVFSNLDKEFYAMGINGESLENVGTLLNSKKLNKLVTTFLYFNDLSGRNSKLKELEFDASEIPNFDRGIYYKNLEIIKKLIDV